MAKPLSIASFGIVLAISACGSHAATRGNGGAGPGAGGPNNGSAGKSAGGADSSAGSGPGSAGIAGGASGAGGANGGALGASGANAGGKTGASGAAGSNGRGGGGGGGGTPLTLPPLVTSAPGAYWKTDGALSDSTAAADVVVNDTLSAQKWEGFGAAFNEQGWSALTSPEMQQRAISLLFSASDGAAFAWGRIPIGANDYATSRYTLDDTGPDVTPASDESNRPAADLTLSQFSLARDGEKLIPYIKAAQAVKPDLRFWANPWTPPAWMKTGFRKSDGWTEVMVPSYYDGGSMRSDAAILTAYAQYFTKFVQGYKDRGIDIELVAPQQEPNFEQSYPSCVWDKTTLATFVGRYLGPAMTILGVKVMLGTLAHDLDFERATAVLADSSAKSVSTVIGAQWGALWYPNISALSSSLPIWATEHKGGNYPWNPSGFPPYMNYAPNDHAYGIESWGEIRDAITKTKVTSYNAWNLVLDKAGWSIDTSRQWAQNALLVADSGTVSATPAYYVFRHLSQYVAPGATVLNTTGGDALAFKNPDGSLVAVIFNRGPAKNDYVVALGSKKLKFAMPSNGWATVNIKP
jgi:glucosylceramidase